MGTYSSIASRPAASITLTPGMRMIVAALLLLLLSGGASLAGSLIGMPVFIGNAYYTVDDGHIGHESLARVTLSNNGTTDLVIYPPLLLQGNIQIRGAMISAYVLKPAEIVDLDIHVTPLQTGAIDATVRFPLGGGGQAAIDMPVYGLTGSLE